MILDPSQRRGIGVTIGIDMPLGGMRLLTRAREREGTRERERETESKIDKTRLSEREKRESQRKRKASERKNREKARESESERGKDKQRNGRGSITEMYRKPDRRTSSVIRFRRWTRTFLDTDTPFNIIPTPPILTTYH